MKNALVIFGLVALLALFALSVSVAVYVAVFWFRADWFQAFIILVAGFSAYASWNAIGMLMEWASSSANTCLRDLEAGK
jgi:hypothetical protein